jgi:uncharacterized protein
MALKDTINNDIKQAMLAKDKLKLEALRAVKSAILLAETEKGGAEGMSEDKEIEILQRLVKQRNESAELYATQGRTDLAEPEIAQAAVITQYLPKQLSEDEITAIVKEIIAAVGASSPSDMGKVMGQASARMKGKADGKIISGIVKSCLAAL